MLITTTALTARRACSQRCRKRPAWTKARQSVSRPASAAVCGSISGAVMAFGLAADQATATAMTKQMTQSFRAEFGCLRCQELVAKNGGRGHCAHMIAWGAQRAEEILAENKAKE